MGSDVDNEARPPRILFLQTATNPALGADAWVLLQIVRYLDRSAHAVHVACHEEFGGAPTPVYSELAGLDDLEVIHCDLGPELSSESGIHKVLAVARVSLALVAFARLAVQIRRRDIQVVHAGDRPRDALAAVLLGRLTGATSIVHVHQVYNPWWTRLLRWSVHRADVVVPVSEFVAASLRDGGVEPGRVRTVLNAIDPDRWVCGDGTVRRAVRAELGITDDAPVILTVCRLFAGKGVGELVRAFAGVHRRVPGARLVVAGNDVTGGSYAAQLADLAAELGVTDSVHFLGRRGDVPELMDAADVFAMPSIGEPFGLVFVEAMSMELPVVALAHGGATEIVVGGETGLLSAPGDVDALEEHLAMLLEDPERRTELGRRGRARVENSFTLERQAEVMAELYTSLTADRPDGTE